jgi:hypothetical protein
MNPSQFYFLILPLASLVIILVIVVFYYSTKQNNKKFAELKLLDQLIQTGAVNKVNFTTALQELVEGKVIDRKSFIRMGQVLEEYLNKSNEEKTEDAIELTK